jgi:hypothetical protein
MPSRNHPGHTDREALDALLDELRREFPHFCIVPKARSRLSRAIDLALKIVTLGRQSRYLSHYHTVLGYTLYVPDGWEQAAPIDRVITLRHERVHLRQRRRYGMIGMALIYLFPFLPLGLAYGRARIEWEAYRETIVATAELRGLDAARSPELRARIVEQFTSAAYGWMWPFRRAVERWIDQALAEVEAGAVKAPAQPARRA